MISSKDDDDDDDGSGVGGGGGCDEDDDDDDDEKEKCKFMCLYSCVLKFVLFCLMDTPSPLSVCYCTMISRTYCSLYCYRKG
jgi:hypothetical protein